MYQIVRLTGWTLDEIDDAPASLVDWMLAIHDKVRKVEAERG